MNSIPRVVIDTNLVLSTLVFAGKTAKLRQAWQQKRFIPLVSRATTKELIRVLAYPKFKLTSGEQEDLLFDYLPFCETISMPTQLPKIPSCRDVFDEPFLLLAVVGNADYLITGDQDLLSIADDFVSEIITVQQFFALLDK